MRHWILVALLGPVAVVATWAGEPPAGPPPDDIPARLLDRRVRSLTRGVVGGPHDFTDRAMAPGDACKGCHIPHVQAVRATTQPSTRPALERYTIPGQRRTFVPGRYTPGPTSLMCMGCHDGTVGTSTINGVHTMLAGVRDGFPVPGDFAWRDHPIGIPYPGGRRDFRPASFVTKSGRVPLPEGRVECISCHDPHNEAGVPGMLVMSNRRSALCLTCHVK